MSEGNEPKGTAQFVFDMAGPFYAQIAGVFEQVVDAPLTAEYLDLLEERPGVYGLAHGGGLVYIGKADKDVRARLKKHRERLSGRIGIQPDDVSFRCVYLEETWDPFKPEAHLIKLHATGSKRGDGWNRRGFGSNEPGRRRVGTILKEGHWHVRYPIDPDWQCEGIEPGSYRALDLVQRIQREAPYWVKVQGVRGGSDPDKEDEDQEARSTLENAEVRVRAENRSVRDLLLAVVTSLPNKGDWQLTQIPSHMLLYRESNADYPRMAKLWPV